jgi:hypothetical protein
MTVDWDRRTAHVTRQPATREVRQYRSEDLLIVTGVAGVHVREDGWAQEVALFVLGHLGTAAIEQQRRAGLDRLADDGLSALLRAARYHRPDIGARLSARVQLQRLGLADKLRDPGGTQTQRTSTQPAAQRLQSRAEQSSAAQRSGEESQGMR